MSKQPKEKSTHLQELEAVFDRRTRRFSPFAVLGLNRPEQDSVDTQSEGDGAGGKDPPTHSPVGPTHPHVPPTHPPTHGVAEGTISVESTEKIGITEPEHTSTTGEWVGGWVGTTHPRVVVVKNTTTALKTTHTPTHPPTPKNVGQKQPRAAMRMQD